MKHNPFIDCAKKLNVHASTMSIQINFKLRIDGHYKIGGYFISCNILRFWTGRSRGIASNKLNAATQTSAPSLGGDPSRIPPLQDSQK